MIRASAVLPHRNRLSPHSVGRLIPPLRHVPPLALPANSVFRVIGYSQIRLIGFGKSDKPFSVIYEREGEEEWLFNEWDSDESGKMDRMLVVVDPERVGVRWSWWWWW